MRFTIHLISAICLGCLMIACNEPSVKDQETNTQIEDSLPPATPTAPVQRPIEVLDLTDEIDLFVVVAGAYSSPEGAQKKANELKSLGFGNADIIQRPGSKLYSALVERFDNEEAAEVFSKELLSNDEIKSYVYQVK